MKHLIVGLCLLLQACSSANYVKTFPDGTKLEASAMEFATDKNIQGFEYKSGDVLLKLKSFDENQTNGLQQVNDFVKSIVQGAVQGAK